LTLEWDENIWYQKYECPKCNYKSIVTNVCRSCPEMPLKEMLVPVYCSTHRVYHYKEGDHRYYDYNGEKTPLGHDSIVMEKTEYASRYNPVLGRNEWRKIKNLPEGAVLK
jgi:hypothetical protein